MKVTVRSPRIEVTFEQAAAWLLRYGYETLPDRLPDGLGFRHIESREIVLLPRAGCYAEAQRIGKAIEDAAELTGKHAIDILREMSEVKL